MRGKGGHLGLLNRALKMSMETNKKIGSQQPSFGQILLFVVLLIFNVATVPCRVSSCSINKCVPSVV